MSETLAYIPTDRLRALASGRDLPTRAGGAALFADISGFTPLTEALARALGPQRGAEELTKHLNAVYDALIGEIQRYGGSVIGFSGDAITCWFDASSRPDATHRAATSAQALQRAMARFSDIALPNGEVHALALKVAVASGEVRRFCVGDPEIQLIDVIAGSLLDRLADAEHQAGAGEIVLDEVAMAHLYDVAALADLRETDAGARYATLASLAAPAPEFAAAAASAAVLDEREARRWLLPAVHERLRDGRGEFLAELRPAVALFMRFAGIDYEADDDAGAKLDAFVREVQHIASRYEGNLIQLTIGDKGSYLYVVFGAPQAHEDDAVRACNAALAFRDLANERSHVRDAQIGISRGRMRTGAYGAPTRRTYGVQGDDVNLAARLMQSARRGEILASQTAQQGAVDAFQWAALPPVLVKGKREPIVLFGLQGQRAKRRLWRQADDGDVPMVGRQAELARIGERLHAARAGRGQIVAVFGEAGMGKSRLVSEALRVAHDHGTNIHVGECESFGVNSSYLAWESIWTGILGLDPDAPAETRVRAAEDFLRRVSPSSSMRLPLLGAVLGLAIPDNDLTRAFDAKLRKTSLESLLVDCLRVACDEGPMAIVIEDAHWLDPLSGDLLDVIGRAIVNLPVLLLIARRPPDAGRAAAPQYERMAHYGEIALRTFTSDEAERLIRGRMSALTPNVPDALVRRITARAEGNPFYIEELLSYLQAQGIAPDDAAAVERLDLPASLHSLILARIDQLTEDQKTLLRVAGVIGRVFKAAVLVGAYPQLGDLRSVVANLSTLCERELTQVDSQVDLSYLFKHVVTQEVAYESLPFATRAMLHNVIGMYLESAPQAGIEQPVDVLAFHFDRTDNVPKKREYLLKAGDVARAAYANASAIEYFNRAMPLLSPPEQVEVRRKLGQVLDLVGRWDDARAAFLEALATARSLGDRAAEARCQAALGELHRKRGEYDLAAEWLDRGRATFESLGDEAGVGQVLHVGGSMAAQRGDYARAEALYLDSLAIRRRLGDKPAIGGLLSNLGIVARYQGDLGKARALHEEGLAIRRELGDRRAIAVSLNNLGNVALDRQDYTEARSRLEEAVGLQREVGDKAYLQNALNNLGNVARAQRDFDSARAHYHESLRLARELGDRWSIAYMLEDIGALAAQEGHAPRALVLIGAAASLREAIGAPLSASEQARLSALAAPAHEALADEDRSAFLAEGRLLRMDEAIDLALVGAPRE